MAGLNGAAAALGYGLEEATVFSEPSDSPSQAAANAFLSINGLPEFVLERLRHDAKTVTRLDPDLAVNRSFSLATKMRLQAEREVKRAARATIERQGRALAGEVFKKIHGFEIW